MTHDSTAAKAIARKLESHGYKADVADHGYAINVYDHDGEDRQRICVVWLPIGEPTPTGLGFKYLWGRAGDEHRADDSTGLDELVALIVATLPNVVEA